MIALEEKHNFLPFGEQYVSLKHEGDKVIAFEKGSLLFVFNFNSHKSYEHYRIGTRWTVEHELVMDTDMV
jgi:1,4-alpha-glucan branching enzyme